MAKIVASLAPGRVLVLYSALTEVRLMTGQYR